MALAATTAWASFHTFAIEQVYSNADGTVQYIVLRETTGSNGQNASSGHAFSSTHAGVTKSFTFPTNLPGNATANQRVLIATQSMAALGFIVPDYTMPDGFLATNGATLITRVSTRLPMRHCQRTALAPSIAPVRSSPISPPILPASRRRFPHCRWRPSNTTTQDSITIS